MLHQLRDSVARAHRVGVRGGAPVARRGRMALRREPSDSARRASREAVRLVGAARDDVGPPRSLSRRQSSGRSSTSSRRTSIERLTLAELAAVAGASPSHFKTLFKRSTAMPVHRVRREATGRTCAVAARAGGGGRRRCARIGVCGSEPHGALDATHPRRHSERITTRTR